ncbi:MAG: 6,7-dimethyl-8-ribityllumazine synthase [Bdellovibrionales bacterium]|nr:6,7-dimethyl-8-ribityllumazine synthase [Bdellovibrionales bacterium]
MPILQGETNSVGGMRIGIVTSRFNPEITERLEQGALTKLSSLGFGPEQLVVTRVPGALEIPLAVQALLNAGCDGVVALGAVIRGETSHYDSVCAGVERGCSHLQLKFKKPVAFGVLTTENDEQALARSGGNMGNKGAEAAEVVIEMIDLLKKIKHQKNFRPSKE